MNRLHFFLIIYSFAARYLRRFYALLHNGRHPTVLLLAVLTANVVNAQNFDHQHSAWTKLLAVHVKVLRDGQASRLNYSGMADEHAVLRAYLGDLSGVSRAQFNGWHKDQQMAFLINAYNAFTVELILSQYPDLDSIRDLGSLFSSPWSKPFIPLLGNKVTLDDIEHKMLRATGVYDDPRVHFAVNCASVGCPPLREEAFTDSQLSAQLDEQARRFLSDSSRNRYDHEDKKLLISKIFDWYGEDFNKSYRGIDSLTGFLATYAEQLTDDKAAQARIRAGHVPIDFLDYDWNLNDTE